MRILFTTVGLPGHFFPLVPLAWAARCAGHQVRVATSANFVSTVVRSGLPAVACGPGTGFVDLADATAARPDATAKRPDATAVRPRGDRERRYAHGRVFGQLAALSLESIDSLVASWRPDVVVSERAEFAGPLAASVRCVPSVEMHWSTAELPEFRAAASVVLSRELAARGRQALPEPSRVLNSWPASLRQPYAIGHRSVRYVPYNGDAQVPPWVLERRQRPRVCVTFGTVLPLLSGGTDAELAAPLLDSLGRMLDAELLLAIDDAVVATWPRLPKSVRYAGRLPLFEVLGSCDLLIHHGGNGTTLTAFAAGCPQVVLPRFDDQLENAAAVVVAGAGRRQSAADATARSLAETCAQVLDGREYRRAAGRVAAEIAAQPSPAEVMASLSIDIATAMPTRARQSVHVPVSPLA